MKTVALSTLIGAAIGFFGGQYVGVAGFGSGIAGEVVFTPIGVLIGGLVGLLIHKR